MKFILEGTMWCIVTENSSAVTYNTKQQQEQYKYLCVSVTSVWWWKPEIFLIFVIGVYYGEKEERETIVTDLSAFYIICKKISNTNGKERQEK